MAEKGIAAQQAPPGAIVEHEGRHAVDAEAPHIGTGSVDPPMIGREKLLVG